MAVSCKDIARTAYAQISGNPNPNPNPDPNPTDNSTAGENCLIVVLGYSRWPYGGVLSVRWHKIAYKCSMRRVQLHMPYGYTNSSNLFTSPFQIATGIAAQLTKSFDTKWPVRGVRLITMN